MWVLSTPKFYQLFEIRCCLQQTASIPGKRFSIDQADARLGEQSLKFRGVFFGERKWFGRKQHQLRIERMQLFRTECRIPIGKTGTEVYHPATLKHVVDERIAVNGHIRLPPDEIQGFFWSAEWQEC